MHTPVLLHEVIEYLDPQRGKKIIDGTANGGGHLFAIEDRGAFTLAIELDGKLASQLERKAKSEKRKTVVVNDNYADMARIAREHDFVPCDGVLLDLGFSSEQLEGRGLSFLHDDSLDMRYSGVGETAGDILNTWDEEDIARILKEYGEERFDGRIARAIVRARPLTTTFQLVDAIQSVVHRTGKLHPATRTFQALRIAVNNELENLKKGLEGAMEVLKEGGVLAVISFHSLEDRIVKKFKKSKLIRPTWEEIKNNRRARSAKLRIIIK